MAPPPVPPSPLPPAGASVPVSPAPAMPPPPGASDPNEAPPRNLEPKANPDSPRNGVSLRLQALGGGRKNERHPDAGLGGFGASYRLNLARRFALEAGLDFLAGRNEHGLSHAEGALLVNGRFTVNPQNPFRVYGVFGGGLSTARVEAPAELPFTIQPERRFYLNGLFAAGVDWQVVPFLSLSLDVGALLRQRLDGIATQSDENGDALDEQPVGAMGRLAVTFYWE